MENKEIYSTEVNKKVKEVIVEDECVSMVTEDGIIKISTDHSQDCCENVYGDFKIVNFHIQNILENQLEKIVIKQVQGMGFLICLEFERWPVSDDKIFIPCYNYQNGYYSSSLSLVVNKYGVETRVDISDLVEDHID